MKTQHTFIFIISLLFCSVSFAQDSNTTTITDSVPKYKQRYGLRVGVDASKLIRSYFNSDYYKGIELVADYRLTHSGYIAAELGSEERTTDEDMYNFTTKGSYIRLGYDINTYENWFGMENVISLGFRYGFSTFNQTLNSYYPYTTSQYWGEYGTSGINNNILGEYSGRSAHWLEFVVGMKVEVAKNVFLGASLRINKLLTDKADETFPNLWIPGFNKVTDGSSFGMGYNYSISYLIPLFKKSNTKKKDKKAKEEKEEPLSDEKIIVK